MAAVGKGDMRATGEAEASSPSPVLQLLPFNAQRPGPEGRQLGRAILSFPSLLLLLLHRQAVGKPSEAALRPGEGRGKALMALQPWLQWHTRGTAPAVLSAERRGLPAGQGHQCWGWEVEEQQQVWYYSAGQDQHRSMSAELELQPGRLRGRSCSLCSKTTSPNSSPNSNW